jgi:hypothetical protein
MSLSERRLAAGIAGLPESERLFALVIAASSRGPYSSRVQDT